MSLRVVTLVSEGFHPETQRPRRADCDARALDMALQLPGARVSALHAGDPASPALRDYLGMGLTDLTVLEVVRECDVGAALIDYLANEKPDVILAGQQADHSETGGFLPYKIAQELRYLLLPMACSMQIDGDAVEILQALPKGKRRRLKAAL
ncbi:MAG: electron transfer flavoprotein subunit beta, partial [Pseudomonadota bacterium]